MSVKMIVDGVLGVSNVQDANGEKMKPSSTSVESHVKLRAKDDFCVSLQG